jgi:hypothetical protein
LFALPQGNWHRTRYKSLRFSRKAQVAIGKGKHIPLRFDDGKKLCKVVLPDLRLASAKSFA